MMANVKLCDRTVVSIVLWHAFSRMVISSSQPSMLYRQRTVKKPHDFNIASRISLMRTSISYDLVCQPLFSFNNPQAALGLSHCTILSCGCGGCFSFVSMIPLPFEFIHAHISFRRKAFFLSVFSVILVVLQRRRESIVGA